MGLGTVFSNKGSRLACQRNNSRDGIGKSNWDKLKHYYKSGIALREVNRVKRREKAYREMKVRNKISEIMVTISDHLQSASPSQEAASKCNICRVPNHLREVREQGFDPKLISIGPYHRRKEHLQPMEEHKKRFLLCLLNSLKHHRSGSRRTPELESLTTNNSGSLEPESSTAHGRNQTDKAPESESLSTHHINQNGSTFERALRQKQCVPTTNAKFEDLVIAMNELETNAKGSYSDKLGDFGPNEFVLMMLLDGCFIVELLRLYAKCESSDKENENDDPIYSTRWMLPILQRDLLLLENQLPFFVLEEIFEITRSVEESYSLTELALRFFYPLLPRDKKLLFNCEFDAEPDHLLGLFRSSFLPSSKMAEKASPGHGIPLLLDLVQSKFVPAFQLAKRSPPIPEVDPKQNTSVSINIPLAVEDRQLIHCVTELAEAGIEFKKREKHDLLDIEFKKGKLYIPPLLIDDQTGPVLLNFVAYEQCNRYCPPYFTHYLLFFDSLVNSSKDVAHLHYTGIIDHVLGSDQDVADLFNTLCKEVVHDVDNCYLSKPLKDVNTYFHTKRHKWRAKLKHDYFSNPWAYFSFFAALFLLFLTTIQAFFSVFGYIFPPS